MRVVTGTEETGGRSIVKVGLSFGFGVIPRDFLDVLILVEP